MTKIYSRKTSMLLELIFREAAQKGMQMILDDGISCMRVLSERLNNKIIN